MDDERNTRRFFVRTSMFEGLKHKPKIKWTCYIIRGDDIVEKKERCTTANHFCNSFTSCRNVQRIRKLVRNDIKKTLSVNDSIRINNTR